MLNITNKKLLVSALIFNSFVLLSTETFAKVNREVIELQQVANKVPAKYPGHFMNDFVKGFYKQFKNTSTTEVELTFTINFTITESGIIDNITLPGIDDSTIVEQSTTLIKSLKKWKPATEDGKTVTARYSVPFYINLSDVKSGNSKPVYYAKKEDSLYQMATYPGGIDAFWNEYNKKRGPSGEANFVGDRLKYTITVTIEKDGTLTSPQVKGIDNDRHQQRVLAEFMEIIEKMTKWFPAMYDSKPIRSKMSFTFTNNVSILEV